MIIGFIGAGKMARALAAGLVRGGVARPEELLCCSRTPESGQPFLDLFPGTAVRWTGDAARLVRESGVVVLAVKPQQFDSLLPLLREASAGKLFLSLAAGVTLEQIGAALAPTARAVRAMPNTPLQVGAGASVYAGSAHVTAADLALVHRILAAAGQAWEVREGQIDAITALSGSGPAYVFHFLDALVRGAIALGLDAALAHDLAVQTLLGSATLAATSKLSLLELADQVKSPRGTTVAGCAVLENNDALNDLVARCLAAAHTRAGELARGEN